MSDENPGQAPDGNGFRVTNREIYDAVMELTKTVGHIDSRVSNIETRASRIDDHEERIRRNEAWRYAIPPALLMAVGAVVAQLFRHS